MKAGELATYLKQFAPDTEMYVIYDGFLACQVYFEPMPEKDARAFAEDGLKPGDLVMYVG